MKIVRRGALPGRRRLRARGRAPTAPRPASARSSGAARCGQRTSGTASSTRCSRSSTRTAIRPLEVVVDAANGMAGTMLPPVLERLPQLDVVACYFEPDGSFPNHEPNPLLPENRAFIVEKTRTEGADLGVAYDGDADRCFFVDDTGEFVPGDFVTALLAQAMLAKEPGAKVIYDVRASWAVPRAIEEAGGVPLVNRVGHAFIKHRMRKEDALFAGEVSAHYYFRDFTQADTGVVPFLVMLELLSQRRQAALRAPRAVPRAVLHHRRDQHAGRRRRAQAPGDQGALRGRGRPDLAPRRDLGRLRRLALQRPPVEHRAAPAPQPRGARRGDDGAPARRGARPDPELARGRRCPSSAGRPTERPPFKYSALDRVWFSDTDAQGVVYYGRYLPYFDHARTEYHRHLGSVGVAGRRVRDARLERRVPRACPVRRPARVLRARGQARPDERDLRVRRSATPGRDADGDGDADARPRRPRDAAADARSRRTRAAPIRAFEGTDLVE